MSEAGLRPAFRALKSRLILVKKVMRTEFRDVAAFSIPGPMSIGIIPIGRYDGMDTLCCGQVLVGGLRANILGTPATEHTRVDLSHIPEGKLA